MKGVGIDRQLVMIRILGALVCALAAVNALAYASSVALPIPISDSWYFIHRFVSKAVTGGLGVADFFMQRGPSDHTQPLQKLLLLADVRWFDMDFRVETLWGTVLGIATCVWLTWFVQRGAVGRREVVSTTLFGCVLFAVGFSLNVTEPYTWYLVAYAWISVVISIVYWLWLSRDSEWKAGVAKAAVASLVLGLLMDEYGIPIFLALVLSTLIADGIRRPGRALAIFGGGMPGIVLSRWLLRLMMENQADADATSGSLSAALHLAFSADVWKAVVYPMIDSLAHAVMLSVAFPRGWQAIQWAIALFLLAAHIAFWWKAFTPAARPARPIFILALSFMLLCYASIAGIWLSRVSLFGWDYLHQPRYVTSYRLQIFALALMFLSPAAGAVAGRAAFWRSLPALAAVMVLVLQVPLSRAAWQSAQSIRNYADNATRALLLLGSDPAKPLPEGCPQVLVICGFPLPARTETMELMQAHHLNIYSEKFRKRNNMTHLAIPARVAAASVAAPACRIGIFESRLEAPQAGHRGDVRLRIDPASDDFQIKYEGRVRYMERAGSEVTVPLEGVRATSQPLRFEAVCKGQVIKSLEIGAGRAAIKGP